MRVSVAGARAADGALRAGMPKVWAALKAMGRAIAAVLSLLWAALSVVARRLARLIALVGAVGWRAFEPAFSKLREPSVSTPLAVTGGVALLGAGARVAIKGADRDTLLALLIGVVILSVLLVARYSDGAPVWLATPLRAAAHGVRKLVGTLGELRLPSARVLRPVGVVAALALVVGVGWLAWQAAPASLRLMQATREATSVKGRAVALSGDTLRVARTTIRLSGIEAPVPGQTCAATRRRRWHCDAAARVALKRLVRRHVVTCALKGKDRRGRTLGSCQAGETDLAAELVRNGHVFAETGLFASYRSLERKARAAKVGIWRGEAERPSDYRAQKWEEAKRDAPDGCPIKGDVKGGRRIYVLPWMRGYERVRIRRSRGERWFCSEAEARQAGWKPSERS